jgi:hypothetical protein
VEPADLISHYRTKGVLVDANLFILLVIGTYRPSRIASHKHLKAFHSDDFFALQKLLYSFERRITTPHILAETHSLARKKLDKREFDGLAASFRKLIEEMFEIYVPAPEIITEKAYPRLGLTDSAIIKASHGVLVLTADGGLERELSRLGRHALNINHIRSKYWT